MTRSVELGGFSHTDSGMGGANTGSLQQRSISLLPPSEGMPAITEQVNAINLATTPNQSSDTSLHISSLFSLPDYASCVHPNGLVYERDAWSVLNVKILDVIPPVPYVDWQQIDPYFQKAYKENFLLLYVPHKVEIDGKEMDFAPKALFNTFREKFSYGSVLHDESAETTAPGWKLISTKFVPETFWVTCQKAEEVIGKQTDFRLPHALEAIALHFLVLAVTGKALDSLGGDATYCTETVTTGGGNALRVVVGRYSTNDKQLSYSTTLTRSGKFYGAIVVQPKS